MEKKVAIILRKPPYGDINAAEAIRHAMGGAVDALSVRLVLVDSGVLLTKKGQVDTGTGYTNLEASLKDCIDMGVEVLIDKSSMKEHYLEADNLVDGIKIVNSHEIAEAVKESDTVMIF